MSIASWRQPESMGRINAATKQDIEQGQYGALCRHGDALAVIGRAISISVGNETTGSPPENAS